MASIDVASDVCPALHDGRGGSGGDGRRGGDAAAARGGVVVVRRREHEHFVRGELRGVVTTCLSDSISPSYFFTSTIPISVLSIILCTLMHTHRFKPAGERGGDVRRRQDAGFPAGGDGGWELRAW